MKLFYAPNACSIGIHVLLEELGLPFDSEAIDLRKGQQYSEGYLAVNPKGKIPALVLDDGRLLTEFAAIAYWLAQTCPQAKLFPEKLDDQTRTLELLDYMIGSIHMRGFAFILAPQKFVSDEAAHAALRSHGTSVVKVGLEHMSGVLGAKDYLLGTFTIADAALFYLTHWATAFNIERPENLASFYARMMGRPAVQRVLERERLAAG